MTVGDVQTYGPYPFSTAATKLQTDSSNSIDPSADQVIAIKAGENSIFYTVVKDT